MHVHYGGIKGSCGVSFNAPVEVTLRIACYTVHQVAVVHRFDGRCSGFDLLTHKHNIHFRKDSVRGYFCIPIVCFKLWFEMDCGFSNCVFESICKVCQFLTILLLEVLSSAEVLKNSFGCHNKVSIYLLIGSFYEFSICWNMPLFWSCLAILMKSFTIHG